MPEEDRPKLRSYRFEPMCPRRHKFQEEHLWQSVWVSCCSGEQLFQEGHVALPDKILVSRLATRFRLPGARPVRASSIWCVAVSLRAVSLRRSAPQAWISFALPRLHWAQKSATLCLIPTASTVGAAKAFDSKSTNRLDLSPGA